MDNRQSIPQPGSTLGVKSAFQLSTQPYSVLLARVFKSGLDTRLFEAFSDWNGHEIADGVDAGDEHN